MSPERMAPYTDTSSGEIIVPILDGEDVTLPLGSRNLGDGYYRLPQYLHPQYPEGLVVSFADDGEMIKYPNFVEAHNKSDSGAFVKFTSTTTTKTETTTTVKGMAHPYDLPDALLEGVPSMQSGPPRAHAPAITSYLPQRPQEYSAPPEDATQSDEDEDNYVDDQPGLDALNKAAQEEQQAIAAAQEKLDAQKDKQNRKKDPKKPKRRVSKLGAWTIGLAVGLPFVLGPSIQAGAAGVSAAKNCGLDLLCYPGQYTDELTPNNILHLIPEEK